MQYTIIQNQSLKYDMSLSALWRRLQSHTGMLVGLFLDTSRMIQPTTPSARPSTQSFALVLQWVVLLVGTLGGGGVASLIPWIFGKIAIYSEDSYIFTGMDRNRTRGCGTGSTPKWRPKHPSGSPPNDGATYRAKRVVEWKTYWRQRRECRSGQGL